MNKTTGPAFLRDVYGRWRSKRSKQVLCEGCNEMVWRDEAQELPPRIDDDGPGFICYACVELARQLEGPEEHAR